MPIDSKFLKTALMSYFRFERTWVTATEVNCGKYGIADVLVDTGEEIIEIEVKRYKNDLLTNELNKQKHELLKNDEVSIMCPNRYYICVPDSLAREAERFVRSLNTDYGLIVVNTKNKLNSRSARIVKHAKKIHELYNEKLSKAIILRLCSEIANIYEVDMNEEFKDELDQDIKINKNFLSDEERLGEDLEEGEPLNLAREIKKSRTSNERRNAAGAREKTRRNAAPRIKNIPRTREEDDE